MYGFGLNAARRPSESLPAASPMSASASEGKPLQGAAKNSFMAKCKMVNVRPREYRRPTTKA
jgi:hypothetical protein